MILYLDASALVKRTIVERESERVNAWIDAAEMVVTGLITRVEVAAAIARASRMKLIHPEEALASGLRADLARKPGRPRHDGVIGWAINRGSQEREDGISSSS